jgi:hypothetical protein
MPCGSLFRKNSMHECACVHRCVCTDAPFTWICFSVTRPIKLLPVWKVCIDNHKYVLMWVSGAERRKEVDSKAYSIIQECLCCFGNNNLTIVVMGTRPMVLSKTLQYFRHFNCVAYWWAKYNLYLEGVSFESCPMSFASADFLQNMRW